MASPQIVILLVGNKKDLEEARQVTFLEASTFAQENGTILKHNNRRWSDSILIYLFADLIFLETSAKTGEQVDKLSALRWLNW